MRLVWIMALACGSLHTSAAQENKPADEAFALPTYAEISAELNRLAEAHGDLVTRHVMGSSRGGRDIEALEIALPEHEPDWPAILVVANLEGPRVFESAVVLHQARRLVEAWQSGDEAARGLLANTVVYFVPCANPDAAVGREATPRAERISGGYGVDNDRDGREGEDPPADVNGDGLITWMRVPDPDGEWRADPEDGRALVKAERKKGERGIWKLYREGRDSDGDERVSEDAEHDTLLNRTFPASWEAHADNAGLFPSDEPETRALMEFVLQHHNLQLVLTYDALDGLVEKQKSVKDDAKSVHRVPPAGLMQSDADLIEEIGRRYREKTDSEVKGVGSLDGSFQRWCYEHRGLWALSARLWQLPEGEPGADEESDEAEEGEAVDSEEAEEDGEAVEAETPKKEEKASEKKDKPSTDAKYLAWIDANSDEAWRFSPWTAFEHPELGEVEIGGFTPYAHYDPPVDVRVAIADAQFDFLLELGSLLPRVSLVECTVEPLGADLWRVEAVLENNAFLPLLSRSLRRTRTTRPARVLLLLPEAGEIIAGSRQTLVRDLQGSGGRHEFSWLVQGPEGMEIVVSVDTDHAGHARETAEVNR